MARHRITEKIDGHDRRLEAANLRPTGNGALDAAVQQAAYVERRRLAKERSELERLLEDYDSRQVEPLRAALTDANARAEAVQLLSDRQHRAQAQHELRQEQRQLNEHALKRWYLARRTGQS